MVLPYINMHPPRVYTCSPSWTPLPPPSPYHPSGSSQCTSPKLPVSCIQPGLAIHFLYDNIHVLMPLSQIIPPPSPTESKRLFYTSVSLLLSHIQGYRYHLSKFHIYALLYCLDVFLYYVFLFLYLFVLNHFSLDFHEWYFSSWRCTLYVWNHVSFFLSHEHFFGQVYNSWAIIFFLNKFLNISQLSLT